TDVFVESFRPGVMERLGLNYDILKKRNPQLIYCSITGYGQDGPYANHPGHDINYLSYAGLLDLMGHENGDPVIPATQIADIGGGALPAAIGILLALYERGNSGEGQFIDISMLDGVISWLQSVLPNLLTGGEVAVRGKEMLNGGRACYAVYETKDEKYLSVGALEPKFWEKFCVKIGREDFVPLLEAPIREQHRLKYEIQKIISEKTLDEWTAFFSDVEACVTPVLTLKDMTKNPQVIARQMIQSFHHEGKSTKVVANPIKLSRTPPKLKQPESKLGEKSNEIVHPQDIKTYLD